MLETYPKEIILQDGAKCTLRPMICDDQEGLYRFFVSLPEQDRRYLRNDTSDRRIIEKWCLELDYDKVVPILAENEGKIVANATLHKQTFGWGRHVGEIRITIGADFQKRGLGSELVGEIAELAKKAKLGKLCARVVSSQTDAIKVFEKNAFIQAGILKKYVKDVHHDEYWDVSILVKDLGQD